jgi:hypothetical protein
MGAPRRQARAGHGSASEVLDGRGCAARGGLARRARQRRCGRLYASMHGVCVLHLSQGREKLWQPARAPSLPQQTALPSAAAPGSELIPRFGGRLLGEAPRRAERDEQRGAAAHRTHAVAAGARDSRTRAQTGGAPVSQRRRRCAPHAVRRDTRQRLASAPWHPSSTQPGRWGRRLRPQRCSALPQQQLSQHRCPLRMQAVSRLRRAPSARQAPSTAPQHASMRRPLPRLARLRCMRRPRCGAPPLADAGCNHVQALRHTLPRSVQSIVRHFVGAGGQAVAGAVARQEAGSHWVQPSTLLILASRQDRRRMARSLPAHCTSLGAV